MSLNVWYFSRRDNSFLEPSDRLPPLELDHDLISTYRLHKIEENVALDGVACKIEGLVDLDETAGH